MTAFTCAHGERYELFGSGGGRRLADEIGAPLLASVPLEPAVALGGDRGEPAALDESTEAGKAFAGLVEAILERCPALQMTTLFGASARRARGCCRTSRTGQLIRSLRSARARDTPTRPPLDECPVF